jgi:hypothetical protein
MLALMNIIFRVGTCRKNKLLEIKQNFNFLRKFNDTKTPKIHVKNKNKEQCPQK